MKRLVDLILSLLGLAVLCPLGLLAVAGIRLSGPGPVFFRQERLGRGGRPFRIFKFRTMTVHAEGSGSLITAAGDCRVTPFGRFLRRHKIDELPQLINVVRGEMSLVGPRPEVPEFAELFPLEYGRILTVRPGITHPATLRYRREESLLAAAPDPRRFYTETLMPAKLAAYEAGLTQSLADDMRTVLATVVPDLVPWWAIAPYTAGHFGLVAPARWTAVARPAGLGNVTAFPAGGTLAVSRDRIPERIEEPSRRRVAAV